MLIQSLIKRKNGTKVQLSQEYHFKPQDSALKPGTPEFLSAHHVAEVKNQRDMAKLLAIPEGYAVFLTDEEDAPAPKAPKAPAKTQQTEPPAPPVDNAGDGTQSNNDGSGTDGAGAGAEGDGTEGEGAGQQDQDSNRASLAAEYQTLTGKLPHGKWNATRIAAEIADLKGAGQ